MGTCFQKNTNAKAEVKPQTTQAKSIREVKTQANMTINENDTHKDMEEWEGDRYKGEGIKRMKGYKCDLMIDALIRLREEFWASRVKNKNIWKVLKIAAMTDHVKSENFLKQNNIKTVSGCINLCVDADNNIYRIPNYCINDPYFEKEILKEDTEKTHDDKLNLNFYDLYENKKISVKLPSNITGAEIKRMYAELSGINLSDYKMRLLFGGAEIKDEQHLYQHKLQNGFTIQILKNKI